MVGDAYTTSDEPPSGVTISFTTTKETLLLERTVSLLRWAKKTPGVKLQLLNYADVSIICEGECGCMSGLCALQTYSLGAIL